MSQKEILRKQQQEIIEKRRLSDCEKKRAAEEAKVQREKELKKLQAKITPKCEYLFAHLVDAYIDDDGLYLHVPSDLHRSDTVWQPLRDYCKAHGWRLTIHPLSITNRNASAKHKLFFSWKAWLAPANSWLVLCLDPIKSSK